MMNNVPHTNVTVVTVTYGKRWHLLRRVLSSVFSQGVKCAIVVDNGSQDSISRNANKEFGENVQVITLATNTGSANGFKTAIEEAIKSDSEFIWLLDDDNLPQPGALAALLAALDQLHSKNIAFDCFALLSFRPDHQADIAAGVPLHRCYPRPGSFFSFNILDLPYKVWRRTSWGHPKAPEKLPDFISIPYAPYSGFFYHRSVIDRIGFPNTEMVLYADDTEFTSRLTYSGGSIFLIPNSRIDDLEESWNTKSQFSSSFLGWLCGSGEIRAYYGARNQAYLEKMIERKKVIRFVNRCTYLITLAVVAVFTGRIARLKLLLRAIRQGEACILGVNERFPLP